MLRGVEQKLIISLNVSFNLVTDLVTFPLSVTNLSDKDGFTMASKAVILSTLNMGSGLPFSYNKFFTRWMPRLNMLTYLSPRMASAIIGLR